MSRNHHDPFSDERSPIMSESSDSSSRPSFRSQPSKRLDWSHQTDDLPSVPDMNAPSKVLIGYVSFHLLHHPSFHPVDQLLFPRQCAELGRIHCAPCSLS